MNEKKGQIHFSFVDTYFDDVWFGVFKTAQESYIEVLYYSI